MNKSKTQLKKELEAHKIFSQIIILGQSSPDDEVFCFDVDKIISFLKDPDTRDIILSDNKDDYKMNHVRQFLKYRESPKLMKYILETYPYIYKKHEIEWLFEDYIKWGLRSSARIIMESYNMDIDYSDGRIWNEVIGRSETETVKFLTTLKFKKIYEYNLMEKFYNFTKKAGFRNDPVYKKNVKTIYEAYYENNKKEWMKIDPKMRFEILLMVKDQLSVCIEMLDENEEVTY